MTEPRMDLPLLGRSDFLVIWDEQTVSGVSSVSALTVSGIDGPGGGRVVEPVEFVRACTDDRAFERWAENPTVKTVTVELLDPAGATKLTFVLEDCVPVACILLDPLDASSAGVALERLQVRCRSIRSIPAG